MSNAFADHFSGHAADYAQFRPTYPETLFDAVTAPCQALNLIWDCGTGNGQAAVALARRAKHVIATDASAEQIEHAIPHPRVEYHVAPAGDVPIEDKTVDLVTVAQALHWFDLDRFYPEVRRVVKPGGVIAAWTYSLFHLADEGPEASAINAAFRRYYEEIVGPYWPPERRHIEAEYRSLPFPFDELNAPDVELRMDWTLEEVVGYLRTWSASQRFREDRGEDPIALIKEDLRAAWGDVDRVRTLRWPVPLRIGRV